MSDQTSRGVALNWGGQEWLADPSGALWWPAQRVLLLADLHFGKIGHFRKAGVPMPQAAFDKSLRLLDQVLVIHQPERLLVLGDLFHSDYNQELEYFRAWRKRHRDIRLELIHGNHDRYTRDFHAGLGIDLQVERLTEYGLHFTHDPAEPLPENTGSGYRIAGHIHPGVALRGGGRQRLVLPCFWFGERQALLPAFGQFTGLALIRPEPGDRVLVLVGEGREQLLDCSPGSSDA